ncbi:HalOD1 output domain-containing protein [Natrinema amylolyticum]|uniref:HalOD1 output domain-containing protein n=1 Tax=Natrinema amylolyticum TaxID=2878679 RepID=UPI001CFBD3EB|nr:HalOD1 output domain-containing protein [Natrinema amylolyticum]
MTRDRESDRPVADGGPEFVTECRPEESTIEAVSRSVAAVRGVSEGDLEPLYENVDVGSLEAMIRHAEERGRSVDVGFTVDGYTVRVSDSREIRIVPNHSERSLNR